MQLFIIFIAYDDQKLSCSKSNHEMFGTYSFMLLKKWLYIFFLYHQVEMLKCYDKVLDNSYCTWDRTKNKNKQTNKPTFSTIQNSVFDQPRPKTNLRTVWTSFCTYCSSYTCFPHMAFRICFRVHSCQLYGYVFATIQSGLCPRLMLSSFYLFLS